MEAFKSCKIIQLSNNNVDGANDYINRVHYAEQQLGYDTSYDFNKKEFVAIWDVSKC